MRGGIVSQFRVRVVNVQLQMKPSQGRSFIAHDPSNKIK